MVERSVYRSSGENRPIEQIILDPFASPYRPTTRVRTRERQITVPEALLSAPVVTSVKTDTDTAVSVESMSNPFSFPLDFKEQTERYEMELIQQALSASQYNQRRQLKSLV